MEEKGLLSMKEVSAMLGLHANTIRRMADNGELPSVRTKEGSGHRRFRREDIEAYLTTGSIDSFASIFDRVHYILDDIPEKLQEKDMYSSGLWNHVLKYYGIRSVFGSLAVHSTIWEYVDIIHNKSFKWIGEGTSNTIDAIYSGRDNSAKFVNEDINKGFAVVDKSLKGDELSFKVVTILSFTDKEGNTWVIDGTLQQFFPNLHKGLVVFSLEDAEKFYIKVEIIKDKKRFTELYNNPFYMQQILEETRYEYGGEEE